MSSAIVTSISKPTPSFLRATFALALAFGALAASPRAKADTIAGPTMTNAESGQFQGLILHATKNATLVSARYPNQGLAADVYLFDESNNIVFMVTTPAAQPNYVIPMNASLVAGHTYRLLALTKNNNYYESYSSFPAVGEFIEVVNGWHGTLFATGVPIQYWMGFNDLVTAGCGDGVVQAGEACDDDNAVETDDCLATCVAASCGDGYVHAGVETCDDSNTVGGDGCSSSCLVEVDAGAPVDAGTPVDASMPEVDAGVVDDAGIVTHPRARSGCSTGVAPSESMASLASLGVVALALHARRRARSRRAREP